MRIRIPSAKADSQFLEQARAALAALPYVAEVTAHPLTGSLLITYAPGAQRDFEGALMTGNGSALPFELHRAVDQPATGRRKKRKRQSSELSQAITHMMTELDDAIKDSTDNVLDLKTLVPLVLAGMGFTYVGTGRGTPVWLTLMIFAFTSFTAFHRGESQEAALETEMMAEELLG
jgi:hypothetical protein